MAWTAKITEVNEQNTAVVVTYQIHNDTELITTRTITMQGDSLQLSAIKLDAENLIRKYKGIQDNIATIEAKIDVTLTYDETEQELTI